MEEKVLTFYKEDMDMLTHIENYREKYDIPTFSDAVIRLCRRGLQCIWGIEACEKIGITDIDMPFRY